MVRIRQTQRFVLIVSLLIGTIAETPLQALMTSQEGNAPLFEANYDQWPGLIKALNDESRVFHVWVNGSESAYYDGDTDAIQRVLDAFAAAKFDEHVVALRPRQAQTTGSDENPREYNCHLSWMAGLHLCLRRRGRRARLLERSGTGYIRRREDRFWRAVHSEGSSVGRDPGASRTIPQGASRPGTFRTTPGSVSTLADRPVVKRASQRSKGRSRRTKSANRSSPPSRNLRHAPRIHQKYARSTLQPRNRSMSSCFTGAIA